MTADVASKVHENEPTVTDDSGSDVSADEEEDHVHGEHCNHDHHDDPGTTLNRNEKKARKILSKMGLKPIPGIERVTIKRSKNVHW